MALGGSTILGRQLANLAAHGVSRVTIVAGHGYDRLRRAISQYPGPLTVDLVYNPYYLVADNLVSLWAARTEMHEDFILINGDNVFHPEILACLDEAAGDACVAISRKTGFDDDDTKVSLADGRVLRIGKDLPPEQWDAASIGIMRFGGPAPNALRQILEGASGCQKARQKLFLDAIQMLVDTGMPVRYCDVGRLPWADVDTPDDLHQVRGDLDRYSAATASPGPRIGRAS